MFDAVLGRVEAQPGRLGRGVFMSVGVHVLAVGLVLAAPRSKSQARTEPEKMVFVQVTPGLPPPPPPPGPQSEKKRSQQPKHRPAKSNMVIPPEKPPEPVPTPPEEVEDDNAGDVSDPFGERGGKPGGVPGGTEGGTGTGPPVRQSQPRPPPPPPPAPPRFDSATMTRPVLVSGAPPAYPARARAARIEETVLVQCIITTEGMLRNCRILKGHPLLNESVLSELASRRYRPVLWGGKPISVNYVFTFHFKLQ